MLMSPGAQGSGTADAAATEMALTRKAVAATPSSTTGSRTLCSRMPDVLAGIVSQQDWDAMRRDPKRSLMKNLQKEGGDGCKSIKNFMQKAEWARQDRAVRAAVENDLTSQVLLPAVVMDTVSDEDKWVAMQPWERRRLRLAIVTSNVDLILALMSLATRRVLHKRSIIEHAPPPPTTTPAAAADHYKPETSSPPPVFPAL